MDSLLLGGKPEGKVFPPHPPFIPPLEFMPFADIFSPQANCTLPPHRPMEISINLKAGSVPPFGGLYNLSLDELSQLKSYIEENLRKGFIQVASASAAAPISFVRVPGKKPRPCVDYHGLNAMIICNSYPIPILGQLLNQLQGCRFLTKINFKAAFNLLCVAKRNEWKTTFQTPWGLYEYLVMPIGLANAPTCFQRFIRHVLREMLNISCFVYIDGILIFSKTRLEHQEHITRVLQKLQEHLLFALPEKSSFYLDRVLILLEGITKEDNKLSTILYWPYPVSLKELN
jgi:hypothetical protein